jgi:hypothetical protein
MNARLRNSRGTSRVPRQLQWPVSASAAAGTSPVFRLSHGVMLEASRLSQRIIAGLANPSAGMYSKTCAGRRDISCRRRQSRKKQLFSKLRFRYLSIQSSSGGTNMEPTRFRALNRC